MIRDPNKQELISRAIHALKSIPICLKLLRNFEEKIEVQDYSIGQFGVNYRRGDELLVYCASAAVSGCKDSALTDLRYFRDRVCIK